MPYQRKTTDEYHIMVDYGPGYEHEHTEPNFREARRSRREYRENAPQYPVKIVKKRVKIEAEQGT